MSERAHRLGQRRVLDVGEPGAALGVGEEEVPQALALARLRLQLLDDRQHDPRVLAGEQLAVVGLLARGDLLLLESGQALQELLRAGGMLEVHRRERTVTPTQPRREQNERREPQFRLASRPQGMVGREHFD